MSRVLRLTSFTEWLKHEIDGYPEQVDIPVYRLAQDTTLIAWMPGNGWAQVPVEDEDKARIYEGAITGGIEELETTIKEHRKSGGINVPITEEEEAEFQKATNMYTRLQMSIPVSNHERILAATRESVALWTADMLEHNVVGQGLNFSDTEKATAEALFSKLPQYHEIAMKSVEKRMAQQKPKAGLIGRLFGR